jgi:hypothetical protein
MCAILVYQACTLLGALLGLAATERQKRGLEEYGYGGGVLEAADQEQQQEHVRTIIITKKVPYPVPKPYTVTVEKKVPYEVKVPVHVAVPKPYPVEVPKPYTVVVEKKVPYTVEKKVPYEVKVPVKVPYPVPHHVEIPKPYPVHVPKPVPVPHPVYVEKKVPVYVSHHEGLSSGGEAQHGQAESYSSFILGGGDEHGDGVL